MIKAKNLIQEIRSRKFKPVYLLCGTESYIADSVFKIICKEYLGEESINAGLQKVEGTIEALKQVISVIDTPVLFSEGRRIFLVQEPKYFKPPKQTKGQEKNQEKAEKKKEKDKKEGQEIVDIIKSFWDKNANEAENIIIFKASEADGRTGIYKLLDKKLNVVVDCAPLKGSELKNWVNGRLKEKKLTIAPDALDKFILYTDGDMQRINGEIEKISCYMGDNEDRIDGDIIESLVFGNPQSNIFRLVDALGEGRPGTALKEMQELFLMNEHPLMILAMVIRQFRLILEMRSFLDSGGSRYEAASSLKVAPFVAKKLEQQSKHYGKNELRKIFSVLLETDHQIKSGKLEPNLAMEVLISRLAG